ncbi:MAG: heat shock 70 family protein [Proteobacteria bacterium]|nr:heat shock 70 family protein [Cystobacterineae bacterium]MCL2258282.1 heat shock 70 family protein [Cystobacterineae bacterium]MCL2315373.1 heat shock 70 family protein [Pseudomonadota bacterium]
MDSTPVIGIDIGSTKIVAFSAQLLEKRWNFRKQGEVCANAYGLDDRGEALLGDAAEQRLFLRPALTVSHYHHLLGRKLLPVEFLRNYSPIRFGIHQTPNGLLLRLGNQELTPTQILSKVLLHFKQGFSNGLSSSQPLPAVAVVPSNFSHLQRQALMEAMELSGIHCKQLLNTPLAIALASKASGVHQELLLTCDFGGTTFETALVEIHGDKMEIVASKVDPYLGGDDFNKAIANYAMNLFYSQTGINLSQQPLAMQRIYNLSEISKKNLDSQQEINFNIPFIAIDNNALPVDLNFRLSQEMLEELGTPLVERAIQLVERLLKETHTDKQKISRVVLVGAQARMPAFQALLSKHLQQSPQFAKTATNCPAMGAAILGYTLLENSEVRFQLGHSTSQDISFEKADGSLHVVIPRSAPLPKTKEVVATTSFDNQTELTLRLFQGDSLANESEKIGEYSFTGMPPGKAGTVKIKIRFELDFNGILKLSAQNAANGQEIHVSH